MRNESKDNTYLNTNYFTNYRKTAYVVKHKYKAKQ